LLRQEKTSQPLDEAMRLRPGKQAIFVELLEGFLLRNPWYVKILQALAMSCFSFRFINLGLVLFTQAREVLPLYPRGL
jgi:hypothetical protein